ncbi:hypothetical protein M406DRAFT_351120 [Cryphonectria parasitica EP155]|uniref:Uncharacterized protein n=1 Tax=Cryphonectria parasitica (strain ATCC 38755 / EP155) TaxID=660469 RepID=A0A9P4Y3Y1_CRYP1|nr:uncharacterized protein M406DRAFT_351120 [Cryphonectria parasitica EP155]KAF3765705.1 hypothetical protein M406DRAFT_351120 [Cryphonectria parasitica EP155]
MRGLLGLTALAATVLARTQVMVPLYVYPGNSTWTNPDWQAAVDAIQANPHLHFYVVINPNSGPLNTSDPTGYNGGYCNVQTDPNYIPHGCNRDWTTHLAAINKLHNAQTLGYVWTDYGARAAADVRADIAEWSKWETAPTWTAGETVNISIHGLWFDEVGAASSNYSTYADLLTYANATFEAAKADQDDQGGLYTVVLNVGTVSNATYEAQLFQMASAVVTKETCYTSNPAASGVTADCPEPYVPFDYTALTNGNGLPHDSAFLPQSVIIVHQFVGPPNATMASLKEQIDGVVDLGVHSTYFTSGSWHNTTISPATIGNVGKLMKQANSAGRTVAGGSGGSSWMPWVPWTWLQ